MRVANSGNQGGGMKKCGSANSYSVGAKRIISQRSRKIIKQAVLKWYQLGQNIDGKAAVDGFGYSVALSNDGKTVAIGAPGHDSEADDNIGHVRIYKWNASMGKWKQFGSNLVGDAAGDLFGWSVALSNDGKTVAIGGAGHVQMHTLNNNAWKKLGSTLVGAGGEDDGGSSVALSNDGKTVAIGDPYHDATGNDVDDNRGHVQVYKYA